MLGKHKARILNLVLEIKEGLPQERTFQVRRKGWVSHGEKFEDLSC